MTALSLLVLGAAGLWLVDHVSLPFAWIALLVVVYCGWQLRRSRATIGKVFWLNFGVVVAVLGMYEVGLWLASAPLAEFAPTMRASDGFVDHVDYGYGPLAPSRTHVVKRVEGKPIYDVIYTVDANGLRVSPPELDADHRKGCVLFLGCSNTFGEGVEDDETLPWQVGVKTAGRFATRNMGFQGWGPHQMLSALQSGNAERAVGCDVTQVVYLALYWHALRVARRSYWDHNGPRYVLDANGRAVRAGYLSDVTLRGAIPRRVLDRLKLSFIYQEYLRPRLDPYEAPIGPKDLDLFAAVVDRSREEAAARFPHASFHVLFWDIGFSSEWTSKIMTRFSRPGITIHRLSEAIPDYRMPFDSRYVLSTRDAHPSPAAYARIADYVVNEILHDSP
jgi:hypothetical protein